MHYLTDITDFFFRFSLMLQFGSSHVYALFLHILDMKMVKYCYSLLS